MVSLRREPQDQLVVAQNVYLHQRTVEFGVGLGGSDFGAGCGTLSRFLLELLLEFVDHICGRRIADLAVDATNICALAAGFFDHDTIAHVDFNLVGDDLDEATGDLDRVHHPQLLGAGRRSGRGAEHSTDGGVSPPLVTGTPRTGCDGADCPAHDSPLHRLRIREVDTFGLDHDSVLDFG
jgi:hypothetical protein